MIKVFIVVWLSLVKTIGYDPDSWQKGFTYSGSKYKIHETVDMRPQFRVFESSTSANDFLSNMAEAEKQSAKLYEAVQIK